MALKPLTRDGHYFHVCDFRIRPEFVATIEGGHFVHEYGRIVSATPAAVLERSTRSP